MVLPNEDDFYRTIMHRSWGNYEHIRDAYSAGHNVHDATQLIATLLLTVCYPIERELGTAFRHLRKSDAEVQYGLPMLPEMQFTQRAQEVAGPYTEEDLAAHPEVLTIADTKRKFDPNTYLGDYLEILRHAIAHGHVAYLARSHSSEVDTIEFRNIRGSGVNDCVEIPISVIERLIITCINIAEQRYQVIGELRSILHE